MILIVATPCTVLLALWGGSCALRSWFGPPTVDLKEHYKAGAGTGRFDHAAFTSILADYVDARGGVDYAGLRKNSSKLNRYLEQVQKAPFEALGRDEKLAFLINAYNAFTLRLILDHWPVASIRDIPSSERWNAVRWDVGGKKLSLTQIEHEYLRNRFVEPRVHFAINCASVGCPPLRRDAYDAKRLEQQLQEQALAMHGDARWLRLEGDVVYLTKLYEWYAGDFVQVGGTVLEYAARFAPALAAAHKQGRRLSISWLDYDWSLNVQRK